MTKIKKGPTLRLTFEFRKYAIEVILKIKIAIKKLIEKIKNSELIWK